MSNSKTVSQRAAAYTRRTSENESYDAVYTRHTSANESYDVSRSSSAWSAGYRAAMRDVQAIVDNQDWNLDILTKICDYIQDKGRLK